MKSIRILLLLLSTCAVLSCNSNDLQEELVGTWTKTEELQQRDGYRLDEIQIFDDFTFERRAEIYGFYEGQTREDVSLWQEYTGLLLENREQLIFRYESSAWFDQKEADPGPFRSALRGDLFEGAVDYKIENKKLTITYISWANDAPVEMVLEYVKVQ